MTTSVSETAPVQRRRLHGRTLAAVLASLLLVNFLAGLDQIIVDTAFPKMIAELRGFDRYTWVLTAYLLASTVIIPVVGKLSDQFGRKGLLISGIILFVISSALAGASQTMNQLIFLRGLQGLSAGAIQVLVSTLIADIFPPLERSRWQGLTTGVYALASVIGPAAGGVITDTIGWRWVFYINVPLVPVALLALIFWLPANISSRTSTVRGWALVRRIDFLGALSAAAGTICLLLGLTWGGQLFPWNSPQVIIILIAAGVCFVAFVLVERFVAVEPILPLNLTGNRVFAASAALNFVTNMALLAALVYIPLFIQGVLGRSATNSGVVVTPLTFSIALSAVLGGLLVRRSRRYQWVVLLGACIFTFGIFLLTGLTPTTSPARVTLSMIILGIGVGMVLPMLTIAVQNAIPRTQLGVGTGAMTYLRSLGSTLGVAVIGTVVSQTLAAELPQRLPAQAAQLPPAALAAATNQQILLSPAGQQELKRQLVQQAVAQTTAQVPPGPQHDQTVAAITQQVTTGLTHLLDQIFAATREALAIGIVRAFWVAFGLGVLVILLGLFLKDVPLRREHQESNEATMAAAL